MLKASVYSVIITIMIDDDDDDNDGDGSDNDDGDHHNDKTWWYNAFFLVNCMPLATLVLTMLLLKM